MVLQPEDLTAGADFKLRGRNRGPLARMSSVSLSFTSRGLGHPKPCSLSSPHFPKWGWDCKGNVFTTDSSGSFRPAIRPVSQREDCVGQESLPEGTLSVGRSHRQGQDKPQTRQILLLTLV